MAIHDIELGVGWRLVLRVEQWLHKQVTFRGSRAAQVHLRSHLGTFRQQFATWARAYANLSQLVCSPSQPTAGWVVGALGLKSFTNNTWTQKNMEPWSIGSLEWSWTAILMVNNQ